MEKDGRLLKNEMIRQATWRQLTVFEAVARLGSFSRAAEELFMTQPGVSIQVRKLSETVGLPLFESTGKQTRLTEAGEKTLEFARIVLRDADNFEAEIAGLKGLSSGSLRISAVTTAECFLPRLLGPFHEAFPGIRLSLEFFNREKVLERLTDNLDDLVVMGRPPAGVEVATFASIENPIVPVARRGHPLAKGGEAPLGVLAREPFLAREAGSGTRAAVEDLFSSRGLSVTPRLVLGSNEALKQAALGGLGICALPRLAIADSSGLVELPAEGFPILRHWLFLHLARKALTAAARAFVDSLPASMSA
ncbi:MAG: LysR family transcriptional regulator [Thermodesulfobacteriota bacterium]